MRGRNPVFTRAEDERDLMILHMCETGVAPEDVRVRFRMNRNQISGLRHRIRRDLAASEVGRARREAREPRRRARAAVVAAVTPLHAMRRALEAAARA
jgi:hypothetical protein